MEKKEIYRQVEGTAFERDLGRTVLVNGKDTPIGIWNLIVSISAVRLFTKGLKPSRHWRLKDVKSYFGVKGNARAVLEALENYRDALR